MKSLRPERARKFAAKFVSNGFNPVQSVVDCGITKNRNSAHVIGYRLLRNVTVQKEIERHLREAKISADEVLEELSTIARAPVEKISEAGKLKALELSGKAHKLFTDKVETSDTSERDGVQSAILQSIESSAKRDGISETESANRLFQALSDHPLLSKPENWPARFREYLVSESTDNLASESEN